MRTSCEVMSTCSTPWTTTGNFLPCVLLTQARCRLTPACADSAGTTPRPDRRPRPQNLHREHQERSGTGVPIGSLSCLCPSPRPGCASPGLVSHRPRQHTVLCLPLFPSYRRSRAVDRWRESINGQGGHEMSLPATIARRISRAIEFRALVQSACGASIASMCFACTTSLLYTMADTGGARRCPTHPWSRHLPLIAR